MKTPTLVILSEVTQECEELERTFQARGIAVLSTDRLKKLVDFVRSRRIVLIVVYDNFLKESKISMLEALELLYSDLKPNILVIGNPLMYQLEKQVHVWNIIDRDSSLEDKIEEISINWESELILIEEEARLMGMHTEEEYIKRLEEDLQIRDRKLSTLFAELSEYKKNVHEINRLWMNLGVKRDSDQVNAFHRLIKNAAGDFGSSETYQHFVEVGEEFYEQLKGLSDKLTQENLRLCGYIRMGLSNKEIAERMNIQHDSVKRTLSRIKTLLEIPKDVTLRKFIRNMDL